ncbi:hypothetical protein [Aestuariivivens marinum]|uniref:hypothetical protein n=1 Tax=Aestuariivivens marinum TaxID=2913555 RepID=UPI001F585F1A|nr:hypothetical protein [Aestuariivivens marinum]
MYWYLIIVLQAFCLYHFYKHRSNYYWVFLILFFPLIGCIIYIILKVYNRSDAEKITNEITHIINPTKKIVDLEKRLQFSESYQNRVNLADAYLEIKDYNNALPHYLEALEDSTQNGFYVVSKLIETYFWAEVYDKVMDYGERIKDQAEFKKSRTQFIYGLALEKLDDLDTAENHLRQIDIRYSFYEERLVLAKFLISRNKVSDAKEILEEIQKESQHMTKFNKRQYKSTIMEVEKILSEL